MKKVSVVVLFIAIAVPFIGAQDVPRAEVFGGYSYLNIDTNGLSARQSAHGWGASAAVNLNKWFAVEGDVSGHYKTYNSNLFLADLFNIIIIPIHATVQDYSFAGGPRVNFRPAFVHALFGIDHLSGSAAGVSLGTQNGFAMLIGGGIDQKIGTHWGVRGGVDYAMSRHNIFGGSRFTQNNIRVSAGPVFFFGGGTSHIGKQSRPSSRTAATTEGTVASVPQLGVSAVEDSHGVRVVAVAPNGPAARVGISERDYILSVDGYNIHTIGELNAALAGKSVVKLFTQINGVYPKEWEVKLK